MTGKGIERGRLCVNGRASTEQGGSRAVATDVTVARYSWALLTTMATTTTTTTKGDGDGEKARW